jgi:hypothetical protein
MAAAPLGALLGMHQRSIQYATGAFASVALTSALYVSIFLWLGVTVDQLAWQLYEAGMCVAPLIGFATACLAAERRTVELEFLVSLMMTVVIGLASGVGAYYLAFISTGFTLLLMKMLRNKKH